MIKRLLGIETEYGIAAEGCDAGDLVRESVAVVRACSLPHIAAWNYRGEDARRDMRGFSVEQLARDPVDAQFDTTTGPRLAPDEERSDRVLANGARLYNDHGHPEYSTPECLRLRDLVAHDAAGERIVLDCARTRSAETGRAVRIYKNNTDYHGASYGTHEDYLMRREVPAQEVIETLLPFLVTRQIFAGAGKVGVEGQRGSGFQLSQRADFASVEASVDTLHNRPIFNTRDEPHATPAAYRRLHAIIGDANMSQWATAMKVGATALVLTLLEDGWRPCLRMEHPVQSMREVSRDVTLRWLVPVYDHGTIPAVDLQRIYLAEAQRRLRGASEDADWALAEWEAVLDDLEGDILGAADRVDWIAKRRLLEEFMASEGCGWEDPVMQSLDLEYHNLDPAEGLYAGLDEAGSVRRIVTDDEIRAAANCPPGDTRAFIRGLLVRRFREAVRTIGWNGAVFQNQGDDFLLDMNPLVENNVEILNSELAGATSLSDVVRVIRQDAADAPAQQ